jgi:hypothetical protein
MSKQNEKFTRQIEAMLENVPRRPFKPDAYYSETGDFIEAIFEPVSYYAEWVNHRMAILRATEDDRIVGCQITWVKSAVAGEHEWRDER